MDDDVNVVEDENVKRLRAIVSKITDSERTNSINLDSVPINEPTHYRSQSNHIYRLNVEPHDVENTIESPSVHFEKSKKKYYRLNASLILKEKIQYFSIFASFGFVGSGTWILSSKMTFYSLVVWLTVIFACYIFYFFKNIIICGYTDNAIREVSNTADHNNFITLNARETQIISAVPVEVDEILTNNITSFPDFCDARLIEKNNQTFLCLTNLYNNHKLFINTQNIYIC
jgi:hypothetical protein